MYTRPANSRTGPATSLATSESLRPQNEQRKVPDSMSTPPIHLCHFSDPPMSVPRIKTISEWAERSGSAW